MKKATILIVEDEAIVALDLQSKLELWGYQVPMTAMTGEEAIRLTGQIRPDLIFMDIGLRGSMDGIQAAEYIRAHMAIPVIFLTAYGDIRTRQHVEAIAPVAFLTKPFSDEDVLGAIDAALNTRQ